MGGATRAGAEVIFTPTKLCLDTRPREGYMMNNLQVILDHSKVCSSYIIAWLFSFVFLSYSNKLLYLVFDILQLDWPRIEFINFISHKFQGKDCEFQLLLRIIVFFVQFINKCPRFLFKYLFAFHIFTYSFISFYITMIFFFTTKVQFYFQD